MIEYILFGLCMCGLFWMNHTMIRADESDITFTDWAVFFVGGMGVAWVMPFVFSDTATAVIEAGSDAIKTGQPSF